MDRDRVHGLDVVIYETFRDAEQSWREIEERGTNFVFQSFDWCATWSETIGRALRVEPVLVDVRDPRIGAAMFLPLGVRPKRFGVRALSFLDGRLADHTAPVLAGPTDTAFDDVRTKAILHRLGDATRADVLDFRHLRGRVGDHRNPLVTSQTRHASYGTHSLRLDGTWEAFCAEGLSSSHQAGSRRRLRRLQERGTPRLVIATSVEQALAILETTIVQKARRYRETGRPSPFDIAAYQTFYRQMTARHHRSGLVHVAALMLDDEMLASHWGCVHRGRFLWLMPSYDAAWSRMSPGRLLLDQLVEWSFKEGLCEFDLTIGDEPYKFTFCNVHEALYGRVDPRSPLGWAYWLKATLDERRSQAGSVRNRPAPAPAARS
jgi:CelD/BcsL family acetyltransferase involved in cellulose biosynthesis